jgi:hypothetical protein
MINHFLYSAEQAAVVQSNQGVINITYKNRETAVHTILLRIISNFIQQKSTLVIMPDTEGKKQLNHLLQQASLSLAALNIDSDQITTEEDFQLIRQKIAQQQSFSIRVDDTAAFLFHETEQEILSFYRETYREQLWEGASWRQILDSYIGFHAEKNINILHSELDLSCFEFTSRELNSIRASISDALFVYQREFEIIESFEKSKNIHAKIHSIDHIERITFELFTFNEIAQELRDQYYSCFHQVEKTFHRDAEIWAAGTLKNIDLLIHKIEKFTARSKEITYSFFAPVNEKRKETEAEKWQLLDSYNQILVELSAKNIVPENVFIKVPSDALPHLLNFKQIVTTWKKNIHKQHGTFIKAANRLNTDDYRLNGLEAELKTLIEKINESGIFDNQLELNTLSFKKQLEYISNLVFDIELMMVRIEKNLPYYQWLCLQDEMDEKSKIVIRILRRFDPADWLTLFESWYHFEVLMRRIDFGLQINEEKFEKAEAWYEKTQKSLIENAILHCAQGHESKLAELKSSNPDVYQTIAKKKKCKHPVAWKFLLAGNASFFSDMFPIVISDNDHLKDLPQGVFSDIIYFDPTGNNLEIMQNFKHIISFYSSDKSLSNADYLLSREQNEMTKSLTDVSTTERLRLVRYLADEMLQFGNIPTIFHLRHACIISFCSDLINDEVNHFLYDFGIKKLHIEKSASETITGTMLDHDRSVYVLIENYLIDPMVQIDQYLWQRNVIKRLENAGCTVLNIDTRELLETKSKQLMSIIDEIRGNHIPKTDHKNQLILELN